MPATRHAEIVMPSVSFTVRVLTAGAFGFILVDNILLAKNCVFRQELTSHTAGIVSMIYKKTNEQVNVGDLIVSLDDRLLIAGLKEAEAALDVAKAQEGLAVDGYNRVNRLKGTDSVSAQQIVEARLKMVQARAGVAQASAALERLKIQLSDTKIKSEMQGVVRGLPQVKGLFVQFGQSLGYVEGRLDGNLDGKGEGKDEGNAEPCKQH